MIKTENPYYNELNFAECDGKLSELTVTITLEEYRELIIQQTRNELKIAELEKKTKELEFDFNTICKLHFANNENFPKAVTAIANLFSQGDKNADDKRET